MRQALPSVADLCCMHRPHASFHRFRVLPYPTHIWPRDRHEWPAELMRPIPSSSESECDNAVLSCLSCRMAFLLVLLPCSPFLNCNSICRVLSIALHLQSCKVLCAAKFTMVDVVCNQGLLPLSKGLCPTGHVLALPTVPSHMITEYRVGGSSLHVAG